MIKTKQYNILHLLSWAPTPDDPTKGNFCIRHINAIALTNPSVILTVISDSNIQQKRNIKQEMVDNYTWIKMRVKACSTRYNCLNRIINKYRIFKGYNLGLNYIKTNIFHPDVVHLHIALQMGNIARYWKWRYKLPYVLTEHWSVYTPQDVRLKNNNKIKRQILLINNHATMITAVSKELKNNMQHYGVKKEIQVIPNVVDIHLFKPKEKLKTDKIQILHVSSLNDNEKNFSGILRVIKRLKEQRNDFFLNVIHDYCYEEYLPYITTNSLSDTIVFHGKKNLEEMVKWYQTADFLIMFSNFETFSCVVMEALACGTPVLATEVGAIPEMLENGRGIVIPPKDEEVFFEKMNFMLDNYHTFSKVELREFAVENFANEIVSNNFANIYNQCFL